MKKDHLQKRKLNLRKKTVIKLFIASGNRVNGGMLPTQGTCKTECDDATCKLDICGTQRPPTLNSLADSCVCNMLK